MSTTRTDHVDFAGDGAMDLYVWAPDHAPRSAVLVIQEIFGVGPYIRAVAERLAKAGYLVGAPDVFWRFAPRWSTDHNQEGLQEAFGKVQQLDMPRAIADCTAALRHLGATEGLTAAPAVLGFCMGGTIAWGVAASAEPSCCVSYYGSGVPRMLDLVDSINCATLVHFGNADQYIPNESIQAVADAIAPHPKFVINVENAGHAFDNHESEMFYNETAAKAAWSKTMAFLGAHLPA